MNSRHLALVCCSLLAALSLGLVGFDHRVSGETSDVLPSWVGVQPSIEKVGDIGDKEYTELHNTNFPCEYVEAKYLGYNSSWAGTPNIEYTSQGCNSPTLSGYYDKSNQAVLPYGTKHIQRLKSTGLDRVNIFSARNTNKLALISNSYAYYYGGTPTLHLINDWTASYNNFQLDSYRNVDRYLSGSVDFTLRYANNEPVDVRVNSVSFSANGKWLYAGATNKSEFIINTDTHEIIPFAPYLDTGYVKYAAVSNDGRYVALSIPYWGMRVYDLTKCQSARGFLESRSCEYNDQLYEVLKTQLETDDLRAFYLQFLGSDNSLEVSTDVHHAANNSWTHEKYRFVLPGHRETKYLAMGDSFSSGEGAYVYRSPTDFFIDDNTYNLCHQSKNSYPYLIQQSQNFDWFNSVACSGARLKDIKSYDAVTDYYEQKPQSLSGVLSDEKASQYTQIFSPGYVSQFEFIRKYHPSVATISIGGNDIGFGDIISTCIINKNVSSGLGQECFKDRKDRELLANQIDQKISALATQYRTIKNSMSGSEPRLYAVGYPQMIRPEGFCGLNVPLLQSELYATAALTDYINSAIKVAADAAGVRFVNMTNAFVSNTGDYRLCSDKSELAVNGLVLLGKSTKKPDQWPYYSESFHPNQLGQTMMADTLKQQTANLTQEMPIVKDSTSSLHDKRIDFVGDDNVLYQNYRITYQKDIAPHLVARGGQATVDSSNDENDLPIQTGTDVTAILHSEPVEIGHLPITLGGKISGNITIPADTEPGYHKLILRYVDIAGNTVERYQFVYVAASDDDWDGDGLSNANDPCSITRQSGVDHDNDGVDDACDDEYVKTASVSSEPSTQTNSSPEPAYSNDSASKVASVSQNFIHTGDTDDDSIFYAQAPTRLPLSVVRDKNKNSDASVKLNERGPFSFFLIGFGVITFGILLAIWLKNHIKS